MATAPVQGRILGQPSRSQTRRHTQSFLLHLNITSNRWRDSRLLPRSSSHRLASPPPDFLLFAMKPIAFALILTATTLAMYSSNAADQPDLTQVAKRFTEQATTVRENETDVTFRYRLLRPHSSSTRKTFPLVFFFHGAGERGSDNLRQLKYFPTWMSEETNQENYPCFILAPQCRADHRWSAHDMTTDMQAALKALDHVTATEKVDPQQILVTGLSMGGAATWEVCMRRPKQIAAGVPVCGRSEEQYATLVKDVPLWIFHGDADRVIPVECSRGMVAAVKAAGGKPRYTELPGVGHDSWTAAYHNREMLDWFFQQRR